MVTAAWPIAHSTFNRTLGTGAEKARDDVGEK